jgi:membrane associated rhomboid family serine protease
LRWLHKLPVVSVLIASAMIATPILLGADLGPNALRFEGAREEARSYLVRHPRLEVDALGELLLDPLWLAEARAAASQSSTAIDLPTRMLARSQVNLDTLIEKAYDARLSTDPAWRFGVLDAQTPRQNYFAHAFVHEAMTGVLLCIVVLLFVGAPLERTWGFGIFAAFTATLIPLSAYAYRLLDASSGIPWSGGSALAGALLGAYFIRGLGGHFILPGWVLLPVWLGVEAFVVRGFWLDDLGSVPWATLCASVGIGALAAGALRLIDVESKLDSRSSASARRAPNPIVARAARLRSDGDPYQAFELIQTAWRENPSDEDVAECFFSIAVEVGQPNAAAEAILPSLRNALRAGDTARALEYWLPIASAETDVRLDATASVRLGEALLDAGHPEQALFSLRGALDAGVSPAHAMRIVKIARDLDEGLTRHAATVALSDPALDPKLRAEFEAISDPPAESAGSAQAGRRSDSKRPTRDPRAEAELPPAAPNSLHAGAEMDQTGLELGEDTGSDANETRILEQGLDPGALSGESLAAEVVAPSSGLEHGATGADVLSHWNDPHSLDGLGDDFGSDLLDGDDLEALEESFPLSETDDFFDPAEDETDRVMASLDDETDTDMTPLVDTSDELTSPIAAPADEQTVWSPSAPDADTHDRLETAATPEAKLPSSADPAATVVAPAFSADEFAIGIEPEPEPEPSIRERLRPLKAIDAVPLDAKQDTIEIDVEGRGKSKLPLSRVETIAMAAIEGLASRPVLVVDFALNWSGNRAEPLKVIRFRSDRFDPRRFEAADRSPLDALTAWVRHLHVRSQADCLPSPAILDGEFVRFATLDAYEHEVLKASRALASGDEGQPG